MASILSRPQWVNGEVNGHVVMIYIIQTAHQKNTNLTPTTGTRRSTPDCKVHGVNMGPIWGRQDPGGPHVGPMNFVIWYGIYYFFWCIYLITNPACHDIHTDLYLVCSLVLGWTLLMDRSCCVILQYASTISGQNFIFCTYIHTYTWTHMAFLTLLRCWLDRCWYYI